MLNIPIVVVAYDRNVCLERLLNSLNRAIYPENVKLIISIDGGGAQSVCEVADKFNWRHGEKEIIELESNLGLRDHVLRCGRLTQDYDGIILLEDDLYVSPHFYGYVQKVQGAYRYNRGITGVALYSNNYNETACLPFSSLDDGYDVFFMQLSCSWGQSWLAHQWKEFDDWYALNGDCDLTDDKSLPPNILIWPKTSWKKYYIKYSIENNKYFVYPRVSLSTNFGDPGVHHLGTKLFQVPLLYGTSKNVELNLPDFSESIAKYDAFCEVIPEVIKKMNSQLEQYDFEVDLYGMKNKKNIAKEYVLSKQDFSEYVASFGRHLKPQEMNIYEDIKGTDFFIGKRECMDEYKSFLPHRRNIFIDQTGTQSYFYALTPAHYECNEGISSKMDEVRRLRNTIRKYNTLFKGLVRKIRV